MRQCQTKRRLEDLFLFEDENLVKQKRKNGIGKQGYCLSDGIADFMLVQWHTIQELEKIPRENGFIQIGFIQKVKLQKVKQIDDAVNEKEVKKKFVAFCLEYYVACGLVIEQYSQKIGTKQSYGVV